MEQLLKIKDIAELMNVREKTVRQWVKKDLIPYTKVGGSLRFDREKIMEWIEQGANS